jgi:hypothetical protein
MCVYCKSKKASALLIVSDGYSDILKPTTINWCGKCKPYKIEYEPECKNGDFDLPDDLNKLRVVELRGELRARDMSTRGRKRELVQRLETALEYNIIDEYDRDEGSDYEDDDEDEWWCCLPQDLNELRVVELKEELRARDMSTRGRKRELVQRLETALEDDDEDEWCCLPDDLGELLVVELKEELRDRDMSTRGRKSELVQRLEAALEDGYDTDCTMPN